MKLNFEFSRKEAHSLSIVLVTTRLFSHMAIDAGSLGNSAWICILAGMLLVMPLAAVADFRGRPANTGIISKAGFLMICLTGIFEAAAVLGLITDTIKCCGMLRASSIWIAIMTLGGCLYILFKNGAGICNAARIWIYAFIALLAIIIIAQFRLYKPAWLLPILSAEISKLAEGTVASAGFMAFAPIIHILSRKDDSKRCSCTASVLVAGGTAAALCALRGMMAPTLTEVQLTRFLTIDMLIANGRETLSLQLPLLLAAYGGYVASMAGYCLTSAAALQKCLSGISGKICAFIIVAAVFAVNMSGIAGRKGILIASGWEFAVAALAVIALICPHHMKKAERSAA